MLTIPERMHANIHMIRADVVRTSCCCLIGCFWFVPGAQVTKEDMEAYRLTKANNDDPLANLSSDVLLDEDGQEGGKT